MVAIIDPASFHGECTGSVSCLSCGRADNLMPNVGQRGGSPSARSNTSTGKLDSMPPSTRHDFVFPSPCSIWYGSKKKGIDIDARTASAIFRVDGSCPYMVR